MHKLCQRNQLRPGIFQTRRRCVASKEIYREFPKEFADSSVSDRRPRKNFINKESYQRNKIVFFFESAQDNNVLKRSK